MEHETLSAEQLERQGRIRCRNGLCILAQWSSLDKSRRTLQVIDLKQVAVWTSPSLALRGKCRCGILYTLQLP